MSLLTKLLDELGSDESTAPMATIFMTASLPLSVALRTYRSPLNFDVFEGNRVPIAYEHFGRTVPVLGIFSCRCARALLEWNLA